MEKLDLKDRKILYELDIDSRQSFSQLGKKVGLSKDIVAYRVKKLQEKGIIRNFYIDGNDYKFGISTVKFYLTYQNITPEIKKEIIGYLIKNRYIGIVHSLEGQYDLGVICATEDIPKFYNIWNDIINKYRNFFSNQVFCVQCMQIKYKKTFLLDDKTDEKKDRIIWSVSSKDNKIEIDSLDKKLLELLNQNSRVKTIEIAEKLNSTVNTINSRIKNLMKNGMIINYTLYVNWPKIGYQEYKADVVLNNPEKKQKIIDYIEQNPNLEYRIASLGYVDLELSFCLNNVNQLHQIMADLSSKFPDAIKSYKYFSITKTEKYHEPDLIEYIKND